MLARIFFPSVCFLLGWAVEAHAQAVQLPTFNFFTVNTTVSVPDGGSAFLGGVNSGAVSQSEFGAPLAGKVPGVGRLFRNEAIASRMGTSRAEVHATIIDLNELDRNLLATAAAERAAAGGVDPAVARKASFLAQNLALPRIR